MMQIGKNIAKRTSLPLVLEEPLPPLPPESASVGDWVGEVGEIVGVIDGENECSPRTGYSQLAVVVGEERK